MNTKDPWLKVLENRVEELRKKEKLHREEISNVIARFRDWATTADELTVYYNAEYEASKITKQREIYKSVWEDFKKAEAELDAYKEEMGF